MSTEEDNFLRNLTVIYSFGNKAFRTLLSNELLTQSLTLSDFISKNQHDIFHLHTTDHCCQCARRKPNARRVLHPKQMEILFDINTHLPCHSTGRPNVFCCTKTNPVVTIDDIDATLAHCLLLNFGMCYQTYTSLKTTTEKIIALRNKYAHSTDLRIPDSEFEHDKYKITNLFCQIYPQNEQALVADEIKEAYRKYLDRGLAKQYHSIMLEEIRCQQELLGKLMEIQDQQKNTNETLQQTNQTFQQTNETFQQTNETFQKTNETFQQTNETFQQTNETFQQTNEALQQTNETLLQLVEYHKPPLHPENLMVDPASRRSGGSRKMNLIEQSKLIVKEHQKDETFIETSALRKGLNILEMNRFLVIISKSGGGKSKMCLEIASHLLEQETNPIIFHNNDIINKRDLVNPKENNLVVLEDIFGKTNINFNNKIHGNILDRIQSWVESKDSNTKVVMTISAEKSKAKSVLQEHQILSNENVLLYLDDEDPLSTSEKKSMLLKHVAKHDLKVSDKPCIGVCSGFVGNHPHEQIVLCSCLVIKIINTDTFEGFPQCCNLFCSCKERTRLGIAYFMNASKSLVEEVNAMRANGLGPNLHEMYKYVLLVYMAITGEKLRTSYHQTDSFLQDKKLKFLFESFGKDTVNIRAIVLNKVLPDLHGAFLRKLSYTDGRSAVYEFQHQTVRQAVLVSYGSEYPNSVMKICDIMFIFDYVVPVHKKLESRLYESKADFDYKIHVPSKKVEEYFYKFLTDIEINKNRNEKGAPFIHVPQSIGKYMKEWYLSEGCKDIINELIEKLSTDSNADLLIKGLLDGLTNSGKLSLILEVMPDFSKKYLPKYGSAYVFHGLIRPLSSRNYVSNYIFTDDEIMLERIITAILLGESKTAFNFGQYVFRIGKEEGNDDFLLLVVSKLYDIASKFEIHRIGIFLDGLFNHGKRSLAHFDGIVKLLSLVQKHGTLETIISYCRPAVVSNAKVRNIVMEKSLLVQKINEKANIYFTYFNELEIDRKEFRNICDLFLIAYLHMVERISFLIPPLTLKIYSVKSSSSARISMMTNMQAKSLNMLCMLCKLL